MTSSANPVHGKTIVLAGPTAVGKSAVAIALAEAVQGEIISFDSMQIYRGLDIGTAKPTAAERGRIPHHLIDELDLDETFNAARFAELARCKWEEIAKRNRVAIFCGGTGFYLKALLEGLGNSPGSDPTLRAQLEKTPLPELLAELEKSDPVAFQEIDQKNPRRIIRAVEVIRLTGKPFSSQKPEPARNDPFSTHVLKIGLRRSPRDLHQRIELRVEEMFTRGLIEEVQGLRLKGLEKNQTAMQAIGYKQVLEHLKGVRSLEATKDLVKIRTRQYSKRQMTWFLRQMHLQWLQIGESEMPSETVPKILALSAASQGRSQRE